MFGPDDENPYGEGLTALCAFYVWLKKNTMKFWAIFNEKFAMPITLARMPKGQEKDDAAKAKVDDFLDNLQSETGFRIPEGFEVEFLEAVRRSEVTYDQFIERCNKEISKLVLGQTLSSEEGKRGQGSYALGQAHLSILDIYVFFDMLLMEAVVNKQLVRAVMDYNYFDGIYPHFEFVNAINWSVFAQAVYNLVNAGVKLPASWVYRMSNIPEPGPDDDVIEGAGGNGPSDGGADNNSFSVGNYGGDMPRPQLQKQNRNQSLGDLIFITVERTIEALKKQIDSGDVLDVESMPRYPVNVSEIKQNLLSEAISARQKDEGKRLSKADRQELTDKLEAGAFEAAGTAKRLIEYEINTTLLSLKNGWNWSDFREELGKRLTASSIKMQEIFSEWLNAEV